MKAPQAKDSSIPGVFIHLWWVLMQIWELGRYTPGLIFLTDRGCCHSSSTSTQRVSPAPARARAPPPAPCQSCSACGMFSPSWDFAMRQVKFLNILKGSDISGLCPPLQIHFSFSLELLTHHFDNLLAKLTKTPAPFYPRPSLLLSPCLPASFRLTLQGLYLSQCPFIFTFLQCRANDVPRSYSRSLRFRVNLNRWHSYSDWAYILGEAFHKEVLLDIPIHGPLRLHFHRTLWFFILFPHTEGIKEWLYSFISLFPNTFLNSFTSFFYSLRRYTN